MEKEIYGGVQGNGGTGQAVEESRMVRYCTYIHKDVYNIKGTE